MDGLVTGMREAHNQDGTPAWAYTDVDGDVMAVFPAYLPDGGRGVNLRTPVYGCTVAAEDVEEFIATMRAALAKAQSR